MRGFMVRTDNEMRQYRKFLAKVLSKFQDASAQRCKNQSKLASIANSVAAISDSLTNTQSEVAEVAKGLSKTNGKFATTTSDKGHGSAPSPFPPPGWKVAALSSGANHTLTILVRHPAGLDDKDEPGPDARQVWVAGTGAEGQLGALAVGSTGSSLPPPPLLSFRRLDLRREVLDPLVAEGTLDAVQSAGYQSPKLVACGWNVSYLVLGPSHRDTDGTTASDLIVSLGLPKDNTFGQLGVRSPAPDSAVHVVDVLAPAPYSVLRIAAGLRHAAVLLASSAEDESSSGPLCLSLVGWGSARHGQVGEMARGSEDPAEASRSRTRPGPVPAIASTPQLMRTWTLPHQSPGSVLDGLALAAGRDHTVALVAGKLAFWGSNRQGQCALAGSAALDQGVVASVACNWNGTSVLLCCRDGHDEGQDRILSSGNNKKGQLGASPTSSAGADPSVVVEMDTSPLMRQRGGDRARFIALASGSEHTLVLVGRGSAQEVWGTGWNEHGNLAQGDEDDRHGLVPLSMPAPGEAQPVSIWAGCGTTFVQTLSARPS
ncbi:uncharacterized protein PFL1_03277 [Pseudozyma flocculosa PF-1]|uniref:Uncharacterized protein n=1 Tax=Pseudozyma flocculosa PF-1 TaxID=1277687 RepID=A0A061H7X5_9BASI|nr:uncharacterized protein PFL1_03277 [Pseudozyma flocculosa PF-1]EPQ28987.1 hypothetical protein PFL1_03277 [Pseudozyma flocculosa PF-1]